MVILLSFYTIYNTHSIHIPYSYFLPHLVITPLPLYCLYDSSDQSEFDNYNCFVKQSNNYLQSNYFHFSDFQSPQVTNSSYSWQEQHWHKVHLFGTNEGLRTPTEDSDQGPRPRTPTEDPDRGPRPWTPTEDSD